MTTREEDIRTQIEAWLKQQGVSVEREVVCGNGVRADLVTPDTVIEVKKYLNRGALYQAHGQGAAYQKLLKKPKLLIIGLAPTTEAKYQEAQRIAENIRTAGVEVVFLDKDPQWAQAALTPVVPLPPPASPSVKLPFEPAPKPDRSSAQATQATRPEANLPKLTGKDIWALLILILFFLWIKAAIWNQAEVDPVDAPPPDAEFISPSNQ